MVAGSLVKHIVLCDEKRRSSICSHAPPSKCAVLARPTEPLKVLEVNEVDVGEICERVRCLRMASFR